MVQIGHFMASYHFQSRLDILRASFRTASIALKSELQHAEKKAAEYDDLIANGGEAVEERDDEGYLLWDQETLLRMEIDASNDALMAIRKAHAIAIYHHWERHIGSFTKASKNSNHLELVTAAKKSGIAMHQKLDAVCDLANTLKHGSANKGRKLMESWKGVFASGFSPTPRTDWYSAVQLTDEHIAEAFEIVGQSGPSNRSAFT